MVSMSFISEAILRHPRPLEEPTPAPTSAFPTGYYSDRPCFLLCQTELLLRIPCWPRAFSPPMSTVAPISTDKRNDSCPASDTQIIEADNVYVSDTTIAYASSISSSSTSVIQPKVISETQSRSLFPIHQPLSPDNILSERVCVLSSHKRRHHNLRLVAPKKRRLPYSLGARLDQARKCTGPGLTVRATAIAATAAATADIITTGAAATTMQKCGRGRPRKSAPETDRQLALSDTTEPISSTSSSASAKALAKSSRQPAVSSYSATGPAIPPSTTGVRERAPPRSLRDSYSYLTRLV